MEEDLPSETGLYSFQEKELPLLLFSESAAKRTLL